MPHRPGRLLLALAPTPPPPHEIIFLLYESKGSLVENERLHKPQPGPSECERRRSLLQGPCCYSKHLPLCGRPSRPIVVQKLVVLPSAPEACGRPPCCFGFRYVVGLMRGPGYHHHWLWPFALYPKAQYRSVFFLTHSLLFSSEEHLQANIPIVFCLLLLYSYSPLVYMLIVLWITLIIHMVIF